VTSSTGSGDRVRVCDVEELSPGERTIITVEGHSIGVFNIEGEYFAIENRCAHDDGPVCHGDVRNALVGEYPGPGERVRESFDGEPAVACPWHGWEYDLATGAHLGDDDVSIPTYDVVIENDTLYLVVE
jgi:nitrite reductase/ring-hydroxylating ferredoxin subunit